MKKRDTSLILTVLPLIASSMALIASSTPAPGEAEATPKPSIELRWTTSLGGTVLTNPVRFPTHRGFVVLHLSEHQGDQKSTAPFSLSVEPHCVELARKSTSDEVIITPFNDGNCVLSVTDQEGTVVNTQIYVGAQAISQLAATPSPAPSPTVEATASPSASPTG